jgi:hypothetical protein
MNDVFHFRNTKSCKNPKPPRTGSLNIIFKKYILMGFKILCFGNVVTYRGSKEHVAVPIKTEDVGVAGISVLSTGDSTWVLISP